MGDGEWKHLKDDSILKKDIYLRAQIKVKVVVPDDADSTTLWKFRLKYRNQTYDTPLGQRLLSKKRRIDDNNDNTNAVSAAPGRIVAPAPEVAPVRRVALVREVAPARVEAPVTPPIPAQTPVQQYKHDPPLCWCCGNVANVMNMCDENHVTHCTACYTKPQNQPYLNKCFFCQDGKNYDQRQFEIGDMNCIFHGCQNPREVLLSCGCFKYCQEHANMMHLCANRHKVDRNLNRTLEF